MFLPVARSWKPAAFQSLLRRTPEMSAREAVSSPDAPKAIGPYSQAIKANGFVFISGQIPIDPATGNLIEGGIEAQTEQVLKNLSAVLQAAGSSWEKVVKTTVFLKNMSE